MRENNLLVVGIRIHLSPNGISLPFATFMPLLDLILDGIKCMNKVRINYVLSSSILLHF
jgi:hypothetical protein